MTVFSSYLNATDSNPEPANTNTIHVGEKPRSISFSGCGFLGVYHIGVASCIKMHAPNWLQSVDRIYGCSAGSLVAAMLLSDVCFGEVCHRMMSLAKAARARYLGPLSPGFKINEILLRDMRCGLPVDAHIRASGKLFISLTRVYDGKNVIVSDYKSREELIQVLLCSCFVPFYSGIFPPKYRGVRYVDGGLSNNLPAFSDTITVSPWSGNSDICPRNDGSVSLLDLSFVNQSIQLTASNLYRCSTMFFPPNPEVLKEFCCQGFRETVQYLRDHGLFETLHPLPNNLSFSALLHKREERRKMTRRMSFTARCLQEKDQRERVVSLCSQNPPNNVSMFSVASSIDEQPVMGPLEECFDETENDFDFITTPQLEELKSQKVYTVIHVGPAVLKDHVVKAHFNLPVAMERALEMSLLDYGKPNLLMKPLISLVGMVQNSTLLRIPLDKTYSSAYFLLQHSAELPNNIRWMVCHLKQLVSKLQSYFKCSGDRLVEKLRSVSVQKEKELVTLSKHMAIAVQTILQAVLVSRFPRSLWKESDFPKYSQRHHSSYNPDISPLLQMV